MLSSFPPSAPPLFFVPRPPRYFRFTTNDQPLYEGIQGNVPSPSRLEEARTLNEMDKETNSHADPTPTAAAGDNAPEGPHWTANEVHVLPKKCLHLLFPVYRLWLTLSLPGFFLPVICGSSFLGELDVYPAAGVQSSRHHIRCLSYSLMLSSPWYYELLSIDISV